MLTSAECIDTMSEIEYLVSQTLCVPIMRGTYNIISVYVPHFYLRYMNVMLVPCTLTKV